MKFNHTIFRTLLLSDANPTVRQHRLERSRPLLRFSPPELGILGLTSSEVRLKIVR
jgi:hypothetical protein